jgi:hypothetical protein
MIVATYSVHDKNPRISDRAAGLGQRRWQIKLYARNGGDQSNRDIRPQGSCYLVDVLPLATEAINELLDEFDNTVTDAGFQVVVLR